VCAETLPLRRALASKAIFPVALLVERSAIEREGEWLQDHPDLLRRAARARSRAALLALGSGAAGTPARLGLEGYLCALEMLEVR
jgi:hypothetical protein